MVHRVKWTSDSCRRTSHHVGIDHCCSEIPVSQQFLHLADIVAVFYQVRCEAVAKRMAACRFRDACARHGLMYRPLEDAWIEMVPPNFAR
jgi:hypothetical protein